MTPRSSNIAIRSAASGEELVRLAADDLPVLAETEGASVLALKQVLAKRINLSRFRQRLLTDGGELLHDDAQLSLPVNLQLVKLELLKLDAERDLFFINACAENRAEEVEDMLCGPQDPNTLIINSDERLIDLIALHVASEHGCLEVVNLLLEAGADKEKRNIDGATPLISAALGGCSEVTRLLLVSGADIEAGNRRGETALHTAAGQGHWQIVRLLLQARAEKDAFDKEGRTPLHLATELGNVEAVRLLLEVGADRDKFLNDGTRPLQLALDNDHVEIVDLLCSFPIYKRQRR